MATVNFVEDSVLERPVQLPKVSTWPLLSEVVIIASDLLTFLSVLIATAAVWALLRRGWAARVSVHFWPYLFLLPVAFALFGLYPGVCSNAVTEVRRTTNAITLMCFVFGIFGLTVQTMPLSSQVFVAVCWLGWVIAIPFARAVARGFFSALPWWGYPVVVFGENSAGKKLIQLLKNRPALGLKPIALIDDCERGSVCDTPILDSFEAGCDLAQRLQIKRAIVVVPGVSGPQLAHFLDHHVSTFSHVTIVSDLFGVPSLGVEAVDIGRTLTFTVRKSLRMWGLQATKRLIDILVAVSASIVGFPLLFLLGALIRLESPGPAIYRHTRIGKNGRPFLVWKFRTMIWDGDTVLKKHLEQDPDSAAEWQRDYKLRFDPRITRIGRFLRKASLDELPQLWNVLKGEMSLVGPRPIIEAEISKYGEAFLQYKQVAPGLTGLWQVSGRNDTGYTERVELDSYYVRNWSPWLDVYILAQTVRIVLTGQGAY
jgi:Undecaprenyl-phosphate galactose phosphotransferase WbaP